MSDWTEDLDVVEREVLAQALHARRVWLKDRIRNETDPRWNMHYKRQHQVCRSLLEALERDGEATSEERTADDE
jgi:hypothetical protein